MYGTLVGKATRIRLSCITTFSGVPPRVTTAPQYNDVPPMRICVELIVAAVILGIAVAAVALAGACVQGPVAIARG